METINSRERVLKAINHRSCGSIKPIIPTLTECGVDIKIKKCKKIVKLRTLYWLTYAYSIEQECSKNTYLKIY